MLYSVFLATAYFTHSVNNFGFELLKHIKCRSTSNSQFSREIRLKIGILPGVRILKEYCALLLPYTLQLEEQMVNGKGRGEVRKE